MNKRDRITVLLVFLFFPFFVFSQTDGEEMLLKDVISELHQHYGYRFTYANDVVEGVQVESMPDDLTFEETIEFLRKETNLDFQFLEANFIAIYRKDLSFTICGYLFDSETNEVLKSATINTSHNYTTTDSLGYFKLKVEESDSDILIRHLGYENSIIPIGRFSENNNCLNLFMAPFSYTLSEITLSGVISKGISKMADGSFSINFSDFGILPGLVETDVLQTVQALPGIQSINETVSDINIRGGTNDQNLLLWDGIRMYQSGHFFGLISMFNPSITSNVSVIKNGTSAEYTGGVSGTIAMKTNSNVNHKLTGSAGSNFISSDVFVDTPLGEKSSIQIAGRKAINELFETPTYSRYFDRILQNTEVISHSENIINSNIGFDFYDTSLRWLYAISDNDHLRVNFINAHNELLFHKDGIINQVGESKENSLIQNSIAGSIYYKRNWSPKFWSTIQAYETDYMLKALNFNLSQSQRLLQENKVSETSVKFDTKYRYNSRIVLLGGYHFIENGTTNTTDIDQPKLKQIKREVIREHGLYSQISYASENQKTYLKVGARYGYIAKFKKHLVEPRLSLNYKLTKHLDLNLRGEAKHQNTSQIINFQTDFLGVEKRRWQLANNAGIPVVASKQVSFGLNYNNRGWLVSAEGYWKEVEGITSQSQGFLNQYIYEKETGSYEIKGLELLLNRRDEKFSNWLSYTYAVNEYTFKEFREVSFPNNLDIRHAVTFGTSYTAGNLKVSAGINWFTGNPTTRPIVGNEVIDGAINYETANSSNLDNYLRIDFSAIYNFIIYQDIKAELGVSVWNSTNEQNVLYNYYTAQNNRPLEIKQNALGVTPNLTFRVKL